MIYKLFVAWGVSTKNYLSFKLFSSRTCLIYFKDQLKSEEVSILQYQVDPAPSVVLVVHGPVAPGQELHRLVFVDLELVVVRPRLELGRVLFHEPFALRIVRRRRRNVPLAAV